MREGAAAGYQIHGLSLAGRCSMDARHCHLRPHSRFFASVQSVSVSISVSS